MFARRNLWLLVPALGLAELGAHVWCSRRAPRPPEWGALADAVERLKQPDQPVVVAPEWAEPLARRAFGDGVFPVAELARADLSGFRRVLEVSTLSARATETRGWRVVSEQQHGAFALRVLENPAPVASRYRFIDHVTPGELSVAVIDGDREHPCPYTDHARVAAGGLHGEVAFPRERFACGGRETSFVGVTIIDDQNYRPRRCIWAQAPVRGALRLRFSNVPLGRSLRGFAGLSYFLFRDGERPPIELAARVGGEVVGSYRHQDEWGWHAFALPTPTQTGTSADVEFEIASAGSPDRDFCFVAESVP